MTACWPRALPSHDPPPLATPPSRDSRPVLEFAAAGRDPRAGRTHAQGSASHADAERIGERRLAHAQELTPQSYATADLPTGPRETRSSTLSAAKETIIIVAFRRHTLLPPDACRYALKATLPQLARSALHRCLQRQGISRLPADNGDKPTRQAFKPYPIGYFHIDIAEVQTADGQLYPFRCRRPHQYVRTGSAGLAYCGPCADECR
ncbi:hypothetical protein Rmf_34220 [Roseomonas fluvialis]|uniref:Transposase n=1 Tax=Roseomonas fluvialis TaxID=1750527 RepID=A0ABN6P695_9PROT|nr:hypothetical protein Rmf_34220 [Roseomonas fluvialis]